MTSPRSGQSSVRFSLSAHLLLIYILILSCLCSHVAIWIKSISGLKILRRRWKGQVRSEKLNCCQEVFFHFGCANCSQWNTLFSHSSVTYPQVHQSHSAAAFEAESTKTGARWGASVCFIPREEGMKAKQALSIFPVSVLPKHASGPGSAAPTFTQDLGFGCDLEILKKHRDWALPESRLQRLEAVFETKSTIRQPVPVFT